MEKYAVSCGCVTGSPDLAGMTKLGDGMRRCPTCGQTYANVDTIHLKDTVQMKDKSDPKPE